jgi:hypothetical protein
MATAPGNWLRNPSGDPPLFSRARGIPLTRVKQPSGSSVQVVHGTGSMIIPLSHDSGEVRRHPWVTYGIILSCALVFLATHVLNRETSGRAERLVGDAYEYWTAHPYLEPAPRLTEITGDPGSAIREQFYAIWDETGEPPVPTSALEMEQKKFD